MGQSVDESITPTLIEQGQPVSSKVMLDLIGALNQFQNSFRMGKDIGAVGVSDFFKALRLLFRVAPMADSETLEDLMVLFDEIYSQYTALRGNEIYREGEVEPSEQVGSWAETIPKVREYLKRMLGSVGENIFKSAKERRQISANLIKTLGFTRLGFVSKPSAEERALAKRTGRAIDEVVEGFYPSPEEGDYGDRGDAGSFGSSTTTSGYFPPGGRPPRFDPSPRANWASRSGAYFGEEYDEDALPTSSAANPMRRMASAEMPTAEGLASAPVFADFSESAAANAAEEAGREDFTSVAESREDSEHRSSASSSRASVSTAGVPKISRKAAIAERASATLPSSTTQQRERRLDAAYQRFGSASAPQKEAIRLAVMSPAMSQAAIARAPGVGVSQPTVSNWLKKAGV
jgi:hypothetical protein